MRRIAQPAAIVAGLVFGILFWQWVQGTGGSEPASEVMETREPASAPPAEPRIPDLVDVVEDPPQEARPEDPSPHADIRQPATEPALGNPSSLVELVVDPSDRPVTDFPVLLEGKDQENGGALGDVLSRNSDIRGRVEFTALELAEYSREFGAELATVELARRLPDPPGVDFELSSPPRDPVILRAPVGRVTLEVVDGSGEPVPERGMLDVSPRCVRRFSVGVTSPANLWLPLDCEYSLRARRFGPGFEAELDCPAMTPEDPNAHHIIELPGRYPALVGRLLLPDGSPAPANTRFEMNCLDLRYYGTNTWFTEDDGFFRIPVMRAQIPRGRPVRIRFASSADGVQEALLEDIVTTVSLDPVDTEVGDVRLEERPILVAGRVVDHQGEPVAKIELTLQHRTAGELWQDFDYQSGRGMSSGMDGSFRYFADPSDPEGEWRVLVNARRADRVRDLVLERVPYFGRGEGDLVIRFVEPAWVEGTLVGGDEPSGLRSSTVFVKCIPSGDPDAELITAHDDADGRGRFRVGPLPPGDGILELRRNHASAPIHELPPVTLRAGRVTELGDVDLNSVQYQELRVTVTNLEKPERVTLWYGPQGAPLEYKAWGKGPNPIPLEIRTLPAQLFVSVDHRMPRVIETVQGDLEVELEPMPKAQVTCTGVAEAAIRLGWEEDHLLVRIAFEPVDGELVPLAPLGTVRPPRAEYHVTSDHGVESSAPLAPRGSSESYAYAEFPRPGRYRVRLLVNDLRQRHAWTNPYPDRPDLGLVDILPGSEQRLRFDLTPE